MHKKYIQYKYILLSIKFFTIAYCPRVSYLMVSVQTLKDAEF